MSSFSDDELPLEISSSSAGPRPAQSLRTANERERVRLVAHSSATAPLEKERQVLLELIDTSSSSSFTAERVGLDRVAVLDVSGSMRRDGKLDKLKTAMKFVISKLGAKDRLSMVAFSGAAKKLCPLLTMTAERQDQLRGMVQSELLAGGSTNMKDGLETGLKVVASRRHRSGRVCCRDPRLYTFAFGADQDAKVLEAIAGNSHGGTFYDVKDGEDLSVHFSALLAGLLSVVVRDLKLTVWEQPGDSMIEKLHPGSYPKEPEDGGGSPVTVRFGDLYGHGNFSRCAGN
ncbi:LOW QUALITY PROTEIN: hypothetical protein U9M48_001897 [Paspalum notatum var. saurae]|uniref:VWFA domain-containing protein n=1 Tax=Paspalum notatum var. saurae TaxID=547442 RepID=A0AAQ3PFD4_PASNO